MNNPMTAYPFDTHKLIEICREYDVSKVGVFGSMVRGEAKVQSYIDQVWHTGYNRSNRIEWCEKIILHARNNLRGRVKAFVA